MKFFVWVKNSYGLPEAQIWFGEQKDGKIGIRALAEKYPYANKPD